MLQPIGSFSNMHQNIDDVIQSSMPLTLNNCDCINLLQFVVGSSDLPEESLHAFRYSILLCI